MDRIKRHFPILLVAGSIVTLCALVTGSFASVARAELRCRIDTQRTLLNRLTEQAARLREDRQRAQNLTTQSAALSDSLIEVADSEALMKQIRQIAEVNSLSVDSLKVVSAVPLAGVTARTIRLQASGGFNGFYAALLQLESASPSIAVAEVRLERLSDGDAELNADVTIRLLLRSTGAVP